MTVLVLDYAAGDTLLINGANISFNTKGRLALMCHARFLIGKQVMRREDVTTDLRHLYWYCQTAYVGPEDDFDYIMEMADAFYRGIGDARLTPAMDLAREGKFYPALKIVRDLIREEDAARACVLAGEAA